MAGTLQLRKRRGRKRQFMIGGGFDLDTIQRFVNWQHVNAAGTVVEFHGELADGTPTCFSLVPLN